MSESPPSSSCSYLFRERVRKDLSYTEADDPKLRPLFTMGPYLLEPPPSPEDEELQVYKFDIVRECVSDEEDFISRHEAPSQKHTQEKEEDEEERSSYISLIEVEEGIVKIENETPPSMEQETLDPKLSPRVLISQSGLIQIPCNASLDSPVSIISLPHADQQQQQQKRRPSLSPRSIRPLFNSTPNYVLNSAQPRLILQDIFKNDSPIVNKHLPKEVVFQVKKDRGATNILIFNNEVRKSPSSTNELGIKYRKALEKDDVLSRNANASPIKGGSPGERDNLDSSTLMLASSVESQGIDPILGSSMEKSREMGKATNDSPPRSHLTSFKSARNEGMALESLSYTQTELSQRGASSVLLARSPSPLRNTRSSSTRNSKNLPKISPIFNQSPSKYLERSPFLRKKVSGRGRIRKVVSLQVDKASSSLLNASNTNDQPVENVAKDPESVNLNASAGQNSFDASIINLNRNKELSASPMTKRSNCSDPMMGSDSSINTSKSDQCLKPCKVLAPSPGLKTFQKSSFVDPQKRQLQRKDNSFHVESSLMNKPKQLLVSSSESSLTPSDDEQSPPSFLRKRRLTKSKKASPPSKSVSTSSDSSSSDSDMENCKPDSSSSRGRNKNGGSPLITTKKKATKTSSSSSSSDSSDNEQILRKDSFPTSKKSPIITPSKSSSSIPSAKKTSNLHTNSKNLISSGSKKQESSSSSSSSSEFSGSASSLTAINLQRKVSSKTTSSNLETDKEITNQPCEVQKPSNLSKQTNKSSKSKPMESNSNMEPKKLSMKKSNKSSMNSKVSSKRTAVPIQSKDLVPSVSKQVDSTSSSSSSFDTSDAEFEQKKLSLIANKAKKCISSKIKSTSSKARGSKLECPPPSNSYVLPSKSKKLAKSVSKQDESTSSSSSDDNSKTAQCRKSLSKSSKTGKTKTSALYDKWESLIISKSKEQGLSSSDSSSEFSDNIIKKKCQKLSSTAMTSTNSSKPSLIKSIKKVPNSSRPKTQLPHDKANNHFDLSSSEEDSNKIQKKSKSINNLPSQSKVGNSQDTMAKEASSSEEAVEYESTRTKTTPPSSSITSNSDRKRTVGYNLSSSESSLTDSDEPDAEVPVRKRVKIDGAPKNPIKFIQNGILKNQADLLKTSNNVPVTNVGVIPVVVKKGKASRKSYKKAESYLLVESNIVEDEFAPNNLIRSQKTTHNLNFLPSNANKASSASTSADALNERYEVSNWELLIQGKALPGRDFWDDILNDDECVENEDNFCFTTSKYHTAQQLYKNPKFKSDMDISKRVIGRIVDEYGSMKVSPLNAFCPLHSRLTSDALQLVRSKFPLLRTGRLTPEEMIIIRQNCKKLMKEFNLSAEDARKMMKELISGASMKMKSRYYLGCFAGQGILERRFIYEVYKWIASFTVSTGEALSESQIQQLENTLVSSAGKTPSLVRAIADCQLQDCITPNRLASKLSKREERIQSNYFWKMQDILFLLEHLFDKYDIRNATEAQKIKFPYKAMGEELGYRPFTLRANMLYLISLLSNHESGADWVDSDLLKALEYVMNNPDIYSCMADVKWKDIKQKLCSSVPLHKLQNIFKKTDAGLPFRQRCLQAHKYWSTRQVKERFDKREIIEFYENLKLKYKNK